MFKLNGIKFNGKSLFLEGAMFTGKKLNNSDKDSCRKQFPRKSRFISETKCYVRKFNKQNWGH